MKKTSHKSTENKQIITTPRIGGCGGAMQTHFSRREVLGLQTTPLQTKAGETATHNPYFTGLGRCCGLPSLLLIFFTWWYAPRLVHGENPHMIPRIRFSQCALRKSADSPSVRTILVHWYHLRCMYLPANRSLAYSYRGRLTDFCSEFYPPGKLN